MRQQKYRFTDTVGTVTWTTTVPGRQWRVGVQVVGGVEFSGVGRVPSAWVHRTDHTLRQTVRFWESQRTTFLRMIRHALAGGLVDVFPDADDALFRPCYLLEPRMDSEAPVEPEPGPFPNVLELDLLWVDNSNVGWDGVIFHA
jgi:hypothetical protein